MSSKMILHCLTSFISLIYFKYGNAKKYWIFNIKPAFLIKNACIIYKSYVINNFEISNFTLGIKLKLNTYISV